MNFNSEYCDPFDGKKENYWMKLEHLGRYLWAAETLKAAGCRYAGDMSCATGYGSRLLGEVLDEVMGADINEAYLPAERISPDGRVKFFCADLDQPFPELPDFKGLDGIVCFETLEHVKKPGALLERFSQSLKTGGKLLLSVPNEAYERFDEMGNNKDIYHLHVFEKDALFEMLEKAGFGITGIFGQDIPNRIVTRMRALPEKTRVELDQSYDYEEEALRRAAFLYAWPEAGKDQDSYSLLILAEKGK